MAVSSFAAAFISSAFAACFAEVCTIPLDTAKVRLQLQKKTQQQSAAPAAGAAVAGRSPGGGTLATIMSIAREEGVAALWKGIIPGLHRQFLYGGLRIGLYEPVKAFFAGGTVLGHCSLLHKILAALTTGVIAITVANPTDLVKVRLQADGKGNSIKRHYSGALNAYATIIRQEGIGALWTGLGPNIARNAIINAAELASYDQFKQMFLKLPGFTDNVFTHILAGLGAGFFAVSIGSPVDVVKSRMMGDSTYRSTLDCFAKTLKNDGLCAFYKGFIANFCRIGSWNVIMFLTLEQVTEDACLPLSIFFICFSFHEWTFWLYYVLYIFNTQLFDSLLCWKLLIFWFLMLNAKRLEDSFCEVDTCMAWFCEQVNDDMSGMITLHDEGSHMLKVKMS